MKEIIRRLLEGSVDSHIHIAPDPGRERSADTYDIALHARGLGMRGVVLKSHDYSTAPLAQVIKKIVPGIELLGSLSLNYAVGGINPDAVESSAKMGARVVWMPTVSSLRDRSERGLPGGISVIDENGKVIPPVRDVLALVRQFDMVVGTGHILKEEVMALFSEALRMGLTKFVVTHPLKVRAPLELPLQKELAEQGAFIEHCFVTTQPRSGNLDPLKIVEAIRRVGPERCFLSTDLGQTYNPPPWEGMSMMLDTLLECGLSEEELTTLVKVNPRRLLGI